MSVAPPRSVEECKALKAWAESEPTESPPVATQAQIEDRLEYLAATLPSRNIDDEAGRKRFAVYVSLLGGYSWEAIAHMAREACRRHDWFPTPKQCLDIISEYRPPVSDREIALRLCQDFTTAQFDRWLANVGNGQPIGDVPEQWKRIAVEQGAIRRLSDGNYVSRALYHGPFKPVQVAA